MFTLPCPRCGNGLPITPSGICSVCGARYTMDITMGSTTPVNNGPIHPNCKVSLDVNEAFSRWLDVFGEGLRRAEKKPQHKEPVPVPQPFYDAFKVEKAWKL